MAAEIRFEELLNYNEEETERWRQCFIEHPEALELKLDLARCETTRETLFHIFACEAWYADCLESRAFADPARFEKIPRGTVEELFAVAAEARDKFRKFIACATEADWAITVPFPEGPWGKLCPTLRKALAHTMVHSIRHWAQLATALRKQGLTQEWGHDLLFTKALA